MNDSTELAGAVTEFGKLLLTAYFSYMRQQGASDEEIDRLYVDSKVKFQKNDPANLPDPGAGQEISQ